MERASPLGESDLERGGSMLHRCEHGGAGVMLYNLGEFEVKEREHIK
jgi:hypothetical protein